MKDFLTKDITIKIFSVVAAILLWLFVMNSNNPFDTRKFYVNLRIQNEDSLAEKGIVLKNRDFRKNIEVVVRGRTEVLKNLTSDDFTAILDFERVKSEDDTKIRIDEPYCDVNEISIINVSPRTIDIELERLKRKTFPIEVQMVGNLKPGYKVVGLTYAPEIIELDGMESTIDTVASVKTVVDVSKLTGIVDINKECKVYNKNGKEIPSLSKNMSVNIKIEVAKEVPISLVVTGRPADEHFEGVRRITPEKALIKGPPEILAKISELKTEPVDIENADRDINVTNLIALPQGVALVDTPKEVSVYISIEKITIREFVFSPDEIQLTNTIGSGTLKYEIKNDKISIRVKGKRSQLDTLNKNSISLYADMGSLEEGVHKVPLGVNLPANFSLVKEHEIDVKIDKISP